MTEPSSPAPAPPTSETDARALDASRTEPVTPSGRSLWTVGDQRAAIPTTQRCVVDQVAPVILLPSQHARRQ